ncbi:ATP-binding protein [Streptomyces sp. NPDC001978]|uniref:ATP-binding protein n=1 Tax=Streptomyces sp. NPDC001978 TaxID=3364627 RepID=UPI00368D1C60
MSDDANRVRLLPWSGAHGQPCLLLTDGDGAASRLADRIEDLQLGLAERLLGRARVVLGQGGDDGVPTGQLADALSDVLLIARSRGARIGAQPTASPGGAPAVPLPMWAFHDVLMYRPAGLRAYGLLTLPGRDLASAPAARHYVRDTAGSWGLPPGAADDLESIAAELVANALEHSDSCSITVTCALADDTATIGVTDEDDGHLPVPPVPTQPPGPEQESGRGLLITGALAARWGTRQSDNRLTVWAEIRVGASRGAAR